MYVLEPIEMNLARSHKGKKDKCIHSSCDPWLYMDFELENTSLKDDTP